MSWLTPKRLDDLSRILRGVALVAGKSASDSKLMRLLKATEQRLTAQAEAQFLQGHELFKQPGPETSWRPNPVATSDHHIVQVDGLQDLSPEMRHSTAEIRLAHYVFPKTVAVKQASGIPILNHLPQPRRSFEHSNDLTPPAARSGESNSRGTTPYPISPQAQVDTHQPATVKSADPNLDQVAVQSVGSPKPGSATQSQSSLPGQQPGSEHVATSPPQPAAPAAPQTGHREPLRSERVSAVPQQPAAPASSAAGGHSEHGVEATQQPKAVAASQAVSAPSPREHSEQASQAPEERDASAAGTAGPSQPATSSTAVEPPLVQHRVLRERRVPSSPLGRAWGFAGMGASLVLGSLYDSVTNAVMPRGAEAGPSGRSGSGYMTEQNAERLANALCRMRGAALKLGQMLSIQDETVLPPQVLAALERVRAGADVMPKRQLEGALRAELGAEWRSKFEHFDPVPRAAASIGQVHQAVLPDGRTVALKIQYPGVARSIESDIDNVVRLITITNMLPKGMFVENAIRVAKRELALECDYEYEAGSQQRYKELVEADPELTPYFNVPDVVMELSTQRLITSEWVPGVPIDKVCEMSQEVRDQVGTRLLALTLRELFRWRFMQTDPNWGNFLYDAASNRLQLIDFGAAKEYPRAFVDEYLRMVAACAERDREGVTQASIKLGFLTGDESPVMLDAHCEAGFIVGMPFAHEGIYDFGSHGGMTSKVHQLGAVMLRHRLTPPPDDAYSLHRKLSGAFLACMKLKARVPCRQLFYQCYDSHAFGDTQQVRQAEDEEGAASAAAL